MEITHPIQCRCGKLRGEVDASARATRGVCYCLDCRAYAYYLGPPEGMLDELGGTEVIAVQPRHVRFSAGKEHLVCMSLTETGTLRWYAACCRTPIGNTLRDVKTSHLGLVHSALPSGGESFGPISMYINRERARGVAPANSLLRFFVAVLGYVRGLYAARITGSYRVNPFFDVSSGAPIVKPIVISADQRENLMRLAEAGVPVRSP